MTSDEPDRSDWALRALAELPEVKELQERLYPLDRAVSFSTTFLSGRDHISIEDGEDGDFSKNVVLPLICQHFELLGLSETLSTLQQEASTHYESHFLNESRLVQYVKMALKSTETVFDVVVGDRRYDQTDVESAFYNLDLVVNEAEADDSPLWEEPADHNVLHYHIKGKRPGGEDGEDAASRSSIPTSAPKNEQGRPIKAFSLNRLIVHLTKTDGVDHHLLSTVLLTYQTFMSPQLFLLKLLDRYNVPSDTPTREGHAIQLQVCNVIKNWIRTYPDDFSPAVRRLLQEWSSTLSNKAHALTMATSLSRLTAGRKIKAGVPSSINAVVPKNVFSSSLQLADVDTEELARQICLFEFAIYRKIRPVELLGLAWSKPKLKHRAPNVLGFIHHFNAFSSWVATAILRSARLTQRTKTFTRMIKLAHALEKLNNYNAAIAILAALNSASVHRLKFTKQGIPDKWVEERTRLEGIMSRDKSFATYRATIAHVDPPCLPYLGLYLTDLTFIDENPDFYELHGRRLISVHKLELQYNVISKLQQYQHLAYNFQAVEQIQKLFVSLPALDTDEHYQLSLKHEPRDCASRADLLL